MTYYQNVKQTIAIRNKVNPFEQINTIHKKVTGLTLVNRYLLDNNDLAATNCVLYITCSFFFLIFLSFYF